MYLNDALIYEGLTEKYEFSKRGPKNGVDYLCRPILFYPGMQPEQNRCYIAQAEALAGANFLQVQCCVIVIGIPLFSCFSSDVSLIYTREKIELGRLLNEVQRIFDRYDEWDNSLMQCIEGGSGLQSLLEFSQPLFGENYLVVLNRNYRVLASTSGRENKTEIMPPQVLSGLKKDPNFVKLITSGKKAFFYKGKYIDHDILFCKIYVHKELWAILTLSEIGKPISLGQKILANHLAKAILSYYRQHIHFFVQGNLEAQSILSKLINGDHDQGGNLRSLMKNLDWDIDAEFKVCYIPISEADKRIGSVQHICHQIELLLHHVVAFEYHTDIVVLLNRTKLECYLADGENQFELFLRNSSLVAGFSRRFSDVVHLKDYYLQAVAALEIGERREKEASTHRFEDVVLDYMLGNLSAAISPESICDKGLLKLKEMDASKGTSYLKTLAVFYSTGMNATHSAKKLFINRSTFLERMARIRKYVDTDIDEGDGRLYLMICLKLLGY